MFVLKGEIGEVIDNYEEQVRRIVYVNNNYYALSYVDVKVANMDNLEVVKAMDIPLDGSISYFPLVDGSGIVTKQLMQDGTSRMIVYKPVETDPKANTTENKEIYVTEEQLEEKLKTFNNEELKQEIEKLKKQIKDLTSNSKK